jgi:hypothetical protein
VRPKIYRAMRPDGDKPMTGSSSTSLGVRVPATSNHPDIVPDSVGEVHPGTGGMSVAPSLRALPFRLIPRRLRHLVPGAGGNDKHYVWSLGDGPFVAGQVATALQLRPDPANSNHGFVEPDAVMSLDSYQDAIRATRDDWSVDER